MTLVHRATSLAWRLAAIPARRRMEHACRDVEGAQRTLLAALVADNGDTAYGRDNVFGRIGSAEAFAEHVPLAGWDAFEPYVERIAHGEPGVLTREPVTLFEPTSGTTGPAKLVPVTSSLREAFAAAASVWVADAMHAFPGSGGGSSYWSLTPLGDRARATSAGIRVGFDDDAEYFGPVARALATASFAVPDEVRLAPDLATARYVTLLFLLAREDLSLVSVWNPSFLTLLVEGLPVHAGSLARDLAQRRVRPPAGLDAALAAAFERRLKVSRARARRVASALVTHEGNPAALHAALWPKLALISCWADANAAPALPSLGAAFPHVPFQAKGLLATEAFVSLPLAAVTDPVLAVGTHFFEFLREDADDDCFYADRTPDADCATLRAWEVEAGADYSVVVTTQGGLYRYRLGDRVRVTGRYQQAPTIRFLGKEGNVSDLVGEKVAEAHARALIDRVTAALEMPVFAMLGCDRDPDGERSGPPSYALFLQVEGTAPDLPTIAEAVENELRLNPCYAYARGLGQLGAARVVALSQGARLAYLEECTRRGTRAGDVKPTALSKDDGWSDVFRRAGLVAAEIDGEPGAVAS